MVKGSVELALGSNDHVDVPLFFWTFEFANRDIAQDMLAERSPSGPWKP
jgi:hypothetical protein